MLREDPELVEWIQDIDNGTVPCSSPAKMRESAPRRIAELPFHPMLQRSIERAQTAIEDMTVCSPRVAP